jgi:hypothetical protein
LVNHGILDLYHFLHSTGLVARGILDGDRGVNCRMGGD